MTVLSFHNTRDYITHRPRLTQPTLMSLGVADPVTVCLLSQQEYFRVLKQKTVRSSVWACKDL